MILINKREIGSLKEEEAVVFLQEHGYSIIERNFWSHFGEIDIIAEENGILTFIEVKSRSSIKYGYPQEAVFLSKQRAIIQTALYYMQKKGIPPECPLRFDVIIFINNSCSLIKNAFGADAIC